MATDMKGFCRLCGKCQTNKTNTAKPQGLLHSLPIPDKLWQSVGMDFMGPLPWSQGNDYLLVIIDQLTSQVHLVPTTMWVTTKEIALLFLKEVVRLHRVPKSIVLQYDTKFTSTFWHELHKLMGTNLLMSTAFHPQTDGATEWTNCSIGQVLRMIIQDDQKDWETKCPMVEFMLNSNTSTTTGFTLFSHPKLDCQCCLTPSLRVSNNSLYKQNETWWQPMMWEFQITLCRHFMPIRNIMLVMNTM